MSDKQPTMNEREGKDVTDFQELKSLHAAALTGEWHYDEHSRFVGTRHKEGGRGSVCEVEPNIWGNHHDTGRFIAAAHRDVPKMLATIAALEARLADREATIKKLESDLSFHVAWAHDMRDGMIDEHKKNDELREHLAEQGAKLAAAEKEIDQSANYVCDRESQPHQVWFANGRTVRIEMKSCRPFLEVDMEIHPSLIREPNAEEVAALNKLRSSDFIERLVNGEFDNV